MQDDEPRQLDFNSMAAYHAAHLIAAKANPTTGLYEPKTTASDALRLEQLEPGEYTVDPSTRRRRTIEQLDDHTGTMSPVPDTFTSAQDAYRQSTTPASGRRTTRSRAQSKKRASPNPIPTDATIYPSEDEQPASTLKKPKMSKATKSPVTRSSPTWDQIAAAKGRTSKYLRKLRRQTATQQDEPESSDGV
jgi:hypothetical protein